MDWEGLAKVLGVVVPAFITLIGIARESGKSTRIRKRLASDAEAAGKLPDGAARDAMLAYVVDEIAELHRLEHETARNLPLVFFAIVGATGLGYLTVLAWQAGEWWTRVLAFPAGALALVFVFGVFDSLERKPKPPNATT